MFTLVQFNDGIYIICKSKDVKKHAYRNTYVAKYKSTNYACRVVAQHRSSTVLNDIKHSLHNDIPKVILQRTLSDTPKKQDQNEKTCLESSIIVQENIRNIYDEDTSNASSNTTFDENFVQSAVYQATNFISNKSTHISSRLDIATSSNVSETDVQNLSEDNAFYNWHGNIFEVYENDLCEYTTTEEIFPKHTEMRASISTTACLENNTITQESIVKNIHNENPSNASYNTAFDENFLQPAVDQSTNSVAKQTNRSVHISNRSEIAMSSNILDGDVEDNVQDLSEACLNSNSTMQDNISKNIHDEDPSYVASNTSSDRNFVQPVMDEATNSPPIESNSSANISSGLDISMSLNVSGRCARDDTEMFVTSVGAGKKKHFCMYCNTFQSKIARHLERVHSNELEVEKFKNIPKGTVERRKIIETLRRRGDFYFNVDCARNDGELLVERRSKEEHNRLPSDYVVCPKCKAFILKLTSRHHYQRCITVKTKDTRSISVLGRQVLGRIHNEANSILRSRIFPLLREDNIIKLVRYDELIIAFGNQQCEKYKVSEHNDAMIRQKIRRVGRLLLTLKSRYPDITDFSSIYYPRYSYACIEAINIMADLSTCGTFYKIPSLASTLGGLIKEIARLLINRSIRKEEVEKKSRAEDFLKVFTEDFATRISKTISETISRNVRRKKIVLPSKADIIKLHNFLVQQRQTAYNSLIEEFSYDAWLSLAKVTLTSIQVFNRRRAGEIQRTLIDDYKAYQGINCETNDMYKALSVQAKQIAKKYVRFTLRGKLGRTVPVLLTAELRNCIEMILKHRKAAKVSSKNPYLFGLPSLKKDKYKYLLACDLLRQYAIESGAENPETLRATELRKHIATICINYNLSENEVSSLANFMGHADKIHLTHYRQPIIEKEILEISQYLEVAQGVDRDESDTDDSENYDDKLSENYDDDVTTTKETYNDQNNNRSESRRITPEFQQNININDSVTSADVSSDNNMQLNEEVNNISKNIVRKRSFKDSQQKSVSKIVSSRNRWTEDEKCVILEAFGNYITSTNNKLPTFNEIGKLIQNHRDILERRSVPMIKAWIYNQKRNKMKQSK